eukprot:UN05037
MGKAESKQSQPMEECVNDNKQDESSQINRIDFAIFSDNKEECICNSSNAYDKEREPIKNCSHLYRIAYALKYYDLLLGNQYRDNIFIGFIHTFYPLCLSDYIHLICEHSSSQDLNKISV